MVNQSDKLTPSEHIERFTLKLKLFRELANLSQLQLAEAVGVSHRTYQRIEAGETTLDLEVIIKICNELKLSFNHWINLESPIKLEQVFILENITEDLLIEEEKEIKDMFFNSLNSNDLSFFSNSNLFKNCSSPVIYTQNTRKFANDRAATLARIENSTKITSGYTNPQMIIDYLDWLNIYKPKFTKVDPISLTMKDGNKYYSLNFHKYQNGDINILSLLRMKNINA